MDEKRALLHSMLIFLGMATGIFSMMCPPFHSVRSPSFHEPSQKEGNVERVRWGELTATLVVISVGVAVADAHRSIMPVVGAASVAAILVLAYEYTMSKPPVGGYN